MKNKAYIYTPKTEFINLSRFSKIKISIVSTIVFTIGIFSTPALAGRFDPPSLKLPLENFDSRIDSSLFNVDFLLAHIVNNSRKTVREVGEITDTVEGLLQDTAIFTGSTGTDSASAGSVIIPPGTTADTIIILNQNEGDSIAIQR
ncbi:hypothetical protein OO007_08810 [Cocleimonas sp. KMM 6892]|uniref:hypothetical protein n=1 Tax=unclassified Cocleimonas TaxID=2639732 RepID=UPI002DBF52C3|nr:MULTISPECIES: hypothetical protein [unclassified Cocleimonas]MEB8432327.1 hypothetical protein [Cocleimonas sp. KMM 6892]MEC4714587.1 hypothetical protein [Cocleimonas sp. KMM 6895]MEC4744599.1 hypothetical protein [Cocleimonas sp. KMM 6896]